MKASPLPLFCFILKSTNKMSARRMMDIAAPITAPITAADGKSAEQKHLSIYMYIEEIL